MKASVTELRKPGASGLAGKWRDRTPAAKPRHQKQLMDLLFESEQPTKDSEYQARIDESLRKAVGKLPGRQRQVLLLRVNEGLTYEQIAARLGLSPRVVLGELARAYSQMRTRLEEDLR